MTRPDIIFADINTIWHNMLASALSERTTVVGLAPIVDPLLRRRLRPRADSLNALEIGLLPGWASRTAFVSQRLMARSIRATARTLANPVALLTSPAYAPLSKYLGDSLPIVTYTADDYSSYEGWTAVRARERKMQARAVLCVFVSEALRRRAIEVDGVPESKTFVSPNATEPRFGPSSRGALPSQLNGRAGPVLGLLGGLSDRLDLDFVSSVVALSSVGTFLVAGPASDDILRRYPVLAGDKVVVTGRLPHSEIHQFAHAMDAALIPYRATTFNRFCSPLRLFDHLASGAWIFALPTCDQLQRIRTEGVTVGPAEVLLDLLGAGIPTQRVERHSLSLYWGERAADLIVAIESATSGSKRKA